ncbi:hypothetical protein DIM_27060 [Candidatus Denitrolinea symbiosum]|nr:hypothetical protein DIM_22160 [Candidatus Denitrolinea symbiosum]GER80625.1 hypothetical protein DIM_27060 [Candidatus Denitrolinea symbiosum]
MEIPEEVPTTIRLPSCENRTAFAMSCPLSESEIIWIPSSPADCDATGNTGKIRAKRSATMNKDADLSVMKTPIKNRGRNPPAPVVR